MTRLRAHDLELAYDRRVVAKHLGIDIPDGSFTVIVGPNACGKSTLLRALARLLRPRQGGVYLDGALITSSPSKEIARELGLLPQSSIAPDGITVADLVARGRYPHQQLLRQWSRDDERAVGAAMAATRVADLADRVVDELSGGQRQRVWLAMALAQETPILLLDEPTTFLDIAHQVEVLDLCAELHAEQGRTLVAVLHDLNQASRYATHLVAMRDGAIVAQGEPAETVTAELVETVFGLPCRVIDDPEAGTPLVLPLGRGVRAPVTLARVPGCPAASSRCAPASRRSCASRRSRRACRASRSPPPSLPTSASSSPARSSPSAGRRPAASWCCRGDAGASRPAPRTSTGATTRSAPTTPRGPRSTSTSSCTATTGARRRGLSAPRPATGSDSPARARTGASTPAAPTGRCCVADETGLPALLAILEALPAGHRATALVEVGDDAERQPVESAADVELHWLSRGGRAPGTTTVLVDALRDLALPAGAGVRGAAPRRGRCAPCATTCASSAVWRAPRCRRSATGSTLRRRTRCGDAGQSRSSSRRIGSARRASGSSPVIRSRYV